MVTKQVLQSETAKNLARMARAEGITGVSSLTKEELIKRLLQVARQKATKSADSAGAKKVQAKPTAASTQLGGRSKAGGKPKAAVSEGGRSGSTKVAARPSGPGRSANRGPVADPVSAKAGKGGKGAVGTSATKSGIAADTAPSSGKSGGAKAAGPKLVAKTPTAKTPTAKPQVAKTQVRPKGESTTGVASRKRPPELEVKATTKAISQPKAAAAKSRPAAKSPFEQSSTDPAVVGKLKSIQERRAAAKDLAFFRQQLSASEEPKKDRIVLFVRDPYWLQAYWEITKLGVERARAAMAEHWHMAEPVLRVLTTDDEGVTGSAEQVSREIKIHGGVNNWYIDVKDPPRSFRVVIGYLAPGNKFHAIAQSNLVRTPVPGSSDHVDHNWTDLADIGDRVFSLSGGFEEGVSTTLREVFEEKLSRPMSRSALSRYGTADLPGKMTGDQFVVDAELLIFGQTHRSAEVTISGEPVKLRDDGSFTVRMGLPDKRQVFPVSSTSFDGTYTYTTVLAIERNTKVMEPMSMEPGEDF